MCCVSMPSAPCSCRRRGSEYGGIVSVNPGRQDLLISGLNGLARVRDGVVRVIDGDRYPWLNRLRGLLQSSRGDTWMLAQSGIIRVATRDLDRAFDRPGSPLPYDLFDAADGFTGRPQKYGYSGRQIFERRGRHRPLPFHRRGDDDAIRPRSHATPCRRPSSSTRW